MNNRVNYLIVAGIITLSGIWLFHYIETNRKVVHPDPVTTQNNIFSDQDKWLTYNNEHYHLSFKYPPELETGAREDSKGLYISLNPKGKTFYIEGSADSLIGLSIDPNFLFSTYQKNQLLPNPRREKIVSFSSQNLNGYKEIYNSPYEVGYFLNYKNHLFTIGEIFTRELSSSETSAYYDMLEKIVKTISAN